MNQPRPSKSASPRDWDERYQNQNTPWNLGTAPPVLLTLLENLQSPPLRVLVPGAGHGHDAIAWARAGHQVLAVDFAPRALESTTDLAANAGVTVQTLEADILELQRHHELENAFDLIWEQTCFCAIPLQRRADYVQSLAWCLRSRGSFRGLFWNHGRTGGPPFDVTPDQIREQFPPVFEVLSLEPVASEIRMRKSEFLATLVRV